MPTEVNFSSGLDLYTMIFGSGLVGAAVLIMLLMVSLRSWQITIAKIRHFKRAKEQSSEFSNIFWDSKNLSRIDDSARRLEGSPLSQIFSAGYRELLNIIQDGKDPKRPKLDPEAELLMVERALKRAEFEENVKLEQGMTFLATVSSSAPFVGLFGTVWGIMAAFHQLGFAKTATIQAVAPGISHALIATAVGLAAAIPAAVAYNYFLSSLKVFRAGMHNFSAEFLGLARQYFSN